MKGAASDRFAATRGIKPSGEGESAAYESKTTS